MDKRGEKMFREVTAVFVDSNDGTNTYTCYAHIGQHGSCCGAWIVEDTRPARPEEYAALLDELTNLCGYDDLQIVHTAKWVK